MSITDVEVMTHLLYLAKCKTIVEKREYLGAALRSAEAQGAHRGSMELGAALGVKQDVNQQGPQTKE